MCKIAGFFAKTGKSPDLIEPLLRSPRSLKALARQEFSGHGIAYVDLATGESKRFRGVESALHDPKFDESVFETNGHARAMAAHIRFATQGLPDLSNTHPFWWEDVSLVMNGNLPNFQKHREEILQLVNPEFRQHIQGQTDTEVALFLYLSVLGSVARDAKHPTSEEAAEALAQTIEVLAYITNKGADFPAGMNFIIVTPEVMVTSRLNRRLSFNDQFGQRRHDEKFEHGSQMNGLAVATLPWKGKLGWQEVPDGSVMAIDLDSRLTLRPAGREDWIPLGPEKPRVYAPEVPE